MIQPASIVKYSSRSKRLKRLGATLAKIAGVSVAHGRRASCLSTSRSTVVCSDDVPAKLELAWSNHSKLDKMAITPDAPVRSGET